MYANYSAGSLFLMDTTFDDSPKSSMAFVQPIQSNT